jgi:uncharacterized membrane protein YhaH (DUF805 family)
MDTAQTKKAPMFEGRIGVGQYWISSLILLIVAGAAGVLIFFGLPVPLGIILCLAPVLIAGIPLYGLQIRRVHDLGISGYVITSIGVVVALLHQYFPIYTTTFNTADMMFSTTKVFHPLGIVIQACTAIGFVVFVSLPGSKKANQFGEPTRYRSIWAAIRGVK